MDATVMNPLVKLREFGQSPWLDYIRRSLLTSGELEQMVKEDGLKGVTSNPAIFEKAITGSTDYAEWLEELSSQDFSPTEVYERLAVRDIQAAADVMRPVYEATDRRDGYVSLEVSPYLADDTEGTIDEARRLWGAVSRENLMIKVPGIEAGIPAIEKLIGEGINVNVTLLFSRSTYERVAEAYIAGMEKWTAAGGEPSNIASVASFFVSRIDGAIDAVVSDRLETAGEEEQELLRSLLGKVAIANAKLSYRSYQRIFRGKRWEALASQGAKPSACCGQARGPRIPTTPTFYTSRS